MKLSDNKPAHDLVSGKNFAALSTVMADGSPHTSVVWVHTDGEHIIFNTAEGRIKTANMRRDPRVSFAVWNSENSYHQAMIRGRVISMTHDGADASIDALSQKYLGKAYPFRQPGEKRVLVKVLPDKIGMMG